MRKLLIPLTCAGLLIPGVVRAQAPTESGSTRSLFDSVWNQVQFGGRLSDIDGDPARWQRYQDLRDGVLVTDFKFAREAADGRWLFKTTADNVGYRDQRYWGTYEQVGRFSVTGLWDEIPQFYSVDTRTPYTTTVSPLLLDDATQSSIQNGQATLSAYDAIATQFDLRERRDIGHVRAVMMATPQLDITGSFTTTKHSGELPWGASFGFSNDVEVALPYDSRTNDLNIGTEWTNGRNMFRVGYTGSWFDNLDDTLVWDSPLDLVDGVENPGRGRMSLWPSNSAQTVTAGGYTKFARRTQLTGFLSYGLWSNDETLQPFTINSALPVLALPRSTAEAEAKVFSTNLNLVSRPITNWSFAGRFRVYDYNNETPFAAIPQYVSYDAEVSDGLTPGPDLYAHSRTTFDADATYTGLQPVALTVGYGYNNSGHAYRTFDSTGENVLRLTADMVSSDWMTFRANYEYADRSGDGLDETVNTDVGEQAAMRRYDIANRTRSRFTGQVDVVPNDVWIFSLSGGAGTDDFDDSYFGLQESTFKTFSVAADYQRPDGWGGGASYNYERYEGLQRSRSASPGQENDPLRDWTADSAERVHYFSFYVTPPRFWEQTEARVTYDFSHAEGSYLYTVQPGGPLPPPSQLPNVFNKLQQLRIDVRRRLTNSLAGTISYLYEPFDVYDFAFDETTINSIIQPSSLVLGYIYRPYTVHSFVFGIRYYW